MRKGIFITYIAFLLFFITFALAFILSSKNIELRSLSAKSSLSDRVYYTFKSIEDGVFDIIENSLGNSTVGNNLNVTVDEQQNFSYVTFVERLPQNVTDFSEDLSKYERFVETYLKDTNLEIDSNIANLSSKMTLLLKPYNITYTHDDFGKREVKIIPIDNADSLGKLNEYDVNIQMINGWNIDFTVPPAWGPLKKDSLRVKINTSNHDNTQLDTTNESLDAYKKSAYQINTEKGIQDGFIKVIIREQPTTDPPGTLRINMQLTEAIITIRLNLTDIPGKTEVELTDGKINVVETLYDISKNDTVFVV